MDNNISTNINIINNYIDIINTIPFSELTKNKRLSKARIEAGLTINEVAERLNTTSQTIKVWEGHWKNPTIDILAKMAFEYNCSISYLLGFTVIKLPNKTSDINIKIQELLDEKDLSANRLAKKIRITPNAFTRWKKKPIISLRNALITAEFFDVSLDYFLGLTDQKTKIENINFIINSPAQKNPIYRIPNALIFEKNQLNKSRSEAGLTINEVAGRLNISSETLENWEEAKKVPNISFLAKLAFEYDCSISYLLGFKTEKESNLSSEINIKLQELLAEKEISLRFLSKETGISIETFLGWKKRKTVSLQLAVLVSNYFDVSIDYFLGLTNNRNTFVTKKTNPNNNNDNYRFVDGEPLFIIPIHCIYPEEGCWVLYVDQLGGLLLFKDGHYEPISDKYKIFQINYTTNPELANFFTTRKTQRD